eukprot:scaffold1199_cov265-Pinguiococcus_pyrenoidosus.AAC.23
MSPPSRSSAFVKLGKSTRGFSRRGIPHVPRPPQGTPRRDIQARESAKVNVTKLRPLGSASFRFVSSSLVPSTKLSVTSCAPGLGPGTVDNR